MTSLRMVLNAFAKFGEDLLLGHVSHEAPSCMDRSFSTAWCGNANLEGSEEGRQFVNCIFVGTFC